MNNINLEELKKDYYNSMPIEDLYKKYNINTYFYKIIKKKLGLQRPKIKRLDYIFNNNNIPTNQPTNPPVNLPANLPVNQPTNLPTNLPANLPANLPVNPPTNLPANPPTNLPTKKTVKKTMTPKNKPNKTNVNIKTIDTDEEIPVYEIKKCDTIYNADKSKLLDALKLSTETLNKVALKKK
jgi:hypothetical protein